MLGRVAVDAVAPLGRLRVGGENDDGGAGRNGTGGGRLQATLVIGEGAAGAGDLTGRIRINVRGRSGSGGSFLNLGGNHQVGRDVLQDKTGHIVAVRLDPDAVDRPVFHGLIGFDSHAADILEGEGFGGLILNRVAAGVDRIHGALIRLDRDDLRTGRLFRNFGEKLTARYGTRIAWYEVGNEWDLLTPEQMTTDEAIELQREAYEGLKAGCPAAKVIPNGWAVVHSDVIPHRTQRNMQERLMTEARAFCDAHTVHQHGPYREYRRRLAEFFAWRKARGIDGMHWYSNETAQTVTGAGETRVAACVWQKILFAWAHGSVDYIWYNLRASGFGPFDGEQGYGVMTGDFYPRAAFASFAGLTSCFEGLRPQECVWYRRRLMGATGVRGGKSVQVLVGWDLRAQTNVTIRVRTDAARAFAVDLFDNRRALPVQDGCVALTFGQTPAAVLLEDVTSAIPDPSDLERGEKPGIQLIALGSQPHCFRLHDYDSVFEMYKADPLHFDRIWKGWNDLIATVRIRRDAGSLKIVAETRDEKLAAADRLVVIVDGVETRFPLEKPIESGGRYVGQIDFPKPDAILEIRIEDDDGQGKEGWVTTGPFKVHEERNEK